MKLDMKRIRQEGGHMEKRFWKDVAAAGLTCLLAVGLAALLAADDPQQYSDWSAPVNLGPIVNSVYTEAGSFISKDGLSFYFSSYLPGGYGSLDIWVSQRASVDDSWGTPQNLGPDINTSGSDTTPTISLDGHWLFFASNRAGGFGGLDLYVSRRHNKRDDFGWQPPVNLGSGVNTAAGERGPAYFEDDESGTITLYFSSTRPGGVGFEDIYASTLQPDETYGSAVLVPELSSPFYDSNPAIRRDGLEMILGSYRPGGIGDADLYVSTRASTADPWSPPVNLGVVVNSSVLDFRPALSFDGTELYFHSARSGGYGGFDVYRSTRTKLDDEDDDDEQDDDKS